MRFPRPGINTTKHAISPNTSDFMMPYDFAIRLKGAGEYSSGKKAMIFAHCFCFGQVRHVGIAA